MLRRRSARSTAVLAVLALAAASSPVTATTRIVTWGDSIVYGYFDGTSSGNDCTNGEPDNNPPEDCGIAGRLRSRLDDPTKFSPIYDVEALNLGKGGEKSGDALSRIDRDSWPCPCAGLGCPINSLKYWYCNGTVQAEDLFVFMEGTNDITQQNVSMETIRANLQAIGDKAAALGLNVLISTLTPRHKDAWTKVDGCSNDGDGDVVTLNGKIATTATTKGWPKVDPYTRLKALSSLFATYYQDWLTMRCDGSTDLGSGLDPVGHPNRYGFDKMTWDATGSTYALTYESVVRAALPPRLTLTTPLPPLSSGASLAFSVTLHDVAAFAQTVDLTWNFGDGTIVSQSASTSPVAKSHTYAGQGSYTVTVTAEHQNGGTRSASAQLNVGSGPLFADGFESGNTSNWIVGSD